MAFTGKQARNGADEGPGGGLSTPPTSWEAQIGSRMGGAESAGVYRFGAQAHEQIFVTPFGTGMGGGVYSNPGGSFWQWDAGLAVSEQPGEASQV